MAFEHEIFCIGYFRTASSTLARALQVLGYNTCGNHDRLRASMQKFSAGLIDKPYQDLLEQYAGLSQQPISSRYRQLHQHYPDAKFILTLRNPQDWIYSRAVLIMNTWFHQLKDHHRSFCPEAYLQKFEDHNAEVQDFFKDKPGKLLVMDIPYGDGWDELCPFLDCVPPVGATFPHVNTSRTMLQRMEATQTKKRRRRKRRHDRNEEPE
jgi:hypothetical protein